MLIPRDCGSNVTKPLVPPPGRDHDLNSIELDHLKLFFHSTYPEHMQSSTPFSWNLYVGLSGKGPESIMPDWSKRGITIEIPNLSGVWTATTFLTILPRTWVRISYPKLADPGQLSVHEIVLPPGDNEAHIPVHYLSVRAVTAAH